MKPRKTLSAYVLLIGILGLTIVGGIVIYQVYSALTKSQLTPEQQSSIKPLDGQIESAVVNNLDQRKVFTETELNSRIQPVELLLSPQPTVTLPPATVSAQIQNE